VILNILSTGGIEIDLLLFLTTNWSWILYWTITGVALVGVLLNIEHDRRCFIIWFFTNAIFAIRTFILGAYDMALLFSIYWVLAIVGIYKWKTNPTTLIEENLKLAQENKQLKEIIQRSVKQSISGGMESDQAKIP